MAAFESTPRAAEGRAPDRVLVALARDGDRAACRLLIERHEAAVGALLQRLLHGSGLASSSEDLAQETFLRVFKALDRFDPDGPAQLSTWMLTIATRLGLQAIARRRLATAPLDESAVASTWPQQEAAAEGARLGERIAAAVGALAPSYRAAFVLREYHGLDYQEIAEALDVDLGTVKSRLSRARKALRRALAEVKHG
ncbi:MAG: sigma-70 family RNA polymerase sigma factor [Myxococcota bacterium]